MIGSRIFSILALTAALFICIETKGRSRKNPFDPSLAKEADDKTRDPRFLSLFSIVTFKNDPCTASSDLSMSGTCMTNSECSSQGGQKDGNCASGFGVCCLFIFECSSSTNVNRNCSYLQNAEYPNAAPASTTCVYTVEATQSDLCYIRLDFDTLTTTGPVTSGNTQGLCSVDTVTVTSPISSTSNAASPPVVCGTLSGQHMYVETGGTGSTAATITIDQMAASTGATHKIKVSLIECSNTGRPPSGCVQYFTGTSGTFASYNFNGGQLLEQQFYTNCIRQEYGYCSFDLRASGTASPDPFQIETDPATIVCNAAAIAGYITVPNDHFWLESGTTYMVAGNMRCGDHFVASPGNSIDASADTTPGVLNSSPVTPFIVRVFTQDNANSGDTAIVGSGFSLDYYQVPCT